ncbi:MAG: PQQ-binding-like beta-propeller repeat protein [Bacteroidales bacterium]|nr:PQQ-binding-like beta-propeller repeat protein [Bacteroidales bacterium]
MRVFISLILCLVALQSEAQFHDWSMWRFDHGRSASTPEQLADNLHLQWQVQYSPRIPVWDDPLNQNLMQFDRLFEPIVADNKIFLGFNDQDKVIALDINSGKELWQYYTDGPVRMPLAANNGNIYFTSDDGNLYCLNADNGSLTWKLSLAPAPNKLLGNKRLISMWPARGGIVIKDDIIYTAASIFPMMGTFIYAINAETGEIVWKNEGTGSNYILQPHRSPAFADVAPQGSFAISGDRLLVAGGRSVPAAFDLKTGEQLYYHLSASGKTGGAFSCGNDEVFFNHHRERVTYMYDSQTGLPLLEDAGEYPVLDGNTIYFSGTKVEASELDVEKNLNKLWDSNVSATNDLIKAGDCLYAADSSGITAIKIVDNEPQELWTHKTEEPIERLVASNGKLIAVTGDGEILVFGDTPVSEVSLQKQPDSKIACLSLFGKRIIRKTDITSGYGVVLGTQNIRLLKKLVSKTSLSLIAFDDDPERISYLREYFDDLGVKADRLSFQNFDETASFLPKYFSSLTVITDPSYLKDNDPDLLNAIFESTRPYDGKIWVKARGKAKGSLMNTVADLDLYGAQLSKSWRHVLISRTGALEGASDWTHNYGDIANTVKSDDEIVKAPLGILWFGGNSNMDVLPRHGHGPSEQVIDGRLIIQGINSITARDVYTGRMIWQKEFENLDEDTWLVYYDETYDEENPLDTKYNQVHLPGANARGTNYIATKEYVYVIEGTNCHLLDIKTGELVKSISTGDVNTEKLGYIGVYDSLLILGNNFSKFYNPDTLEESKKQKFNNFDITASKELIIMDRFTGDELWNIKANHGFIHNAVIAGDGKLFCLDKLPQNLETKLKRRGESQPSGSRMLYLNIKTGEKLHEETSNIFGSWLGYSSEYQLLIQANRPSRDMLTGEEGKRMIVYNLKSNEILWDKPVYYSNPPIISGDKIYTSEEGFSLLTGEELYEKDLITGEDLKWNFKREYGCGYIVASEHLLTFRSASAGFVNLNASEGTASLGGFKSGCTANLIVANGVLNSPDYTRTCQCAYQNQTSLALVNMPWMTYWGNSNYKWNGTQIKQLGLNLNAPGDRTSDQSTLWLEFPNVAGESTGIPVKIDTVNYYEIRKEPISINSENTPWISASSIGGIRSLEITLSKEPTVEDAFYSVNLYFSEPEKMKKGERVFDVSIQDMKVLENFDIIGEAGSEDKELVKSFPGIKAGRTLTIDMIPRKGNTMLSGIELIRESSPLTQNQ